MNDKTQNSMDPILETNQMVLEAFEISTTETAGAVKDGNSIECIAKNFEQYVQHHQDNWQTAWLDTITQFEKEVEGWQDAVSIFQAQVQVAAQTNGQNAQSSKASQPVKSAPAPKAKKGAAKTSPKPKTGENG